LVCGLNGVLVANSLGQMLRAAFLSALFLCCSSHKLAAAPALQNEVEPSKLKQAGSLKFLNQLQLKTQTKGQEGSQDPNSFKQLLEQLTNAVDDVEQSAKASVVNAVTSTVEAASSATQRAAQAVEVSKKPEPGASRIPNRLLFNHKVNLLEKTEAELAGDQQALLLRENVLHILSIFPEVAREDVHFWDDSACQNGLESLEMEESEALGIDFASEKVGMVKSDMCRLAMMYKLGGYYFDTDILPTAALKRRLLREATFSTVVADSGNAYFQAFMAATPNHPLIAEALLEFKDWYDKLHRPGANEVLLRERTEHGNIGTALLKKAFVKWSKGAHPSPRVVHPGGHISQFFEEHPIRTLRGYHGLLPGHSGFLCDYAVVDPLSRSAVMFSRIYDTHHRQKCKEEVHLMKS